MTFKVILDQIQKSQTGISLAFLIKSLSTILYLTRTRYLTDAVPPTPKSSTVQRNAL